MHSTTQQLEAIHAMMARGHRSVRMERHTLLLWGLAAAALILVVDPIFSHERFPVTWQRALVANGFTALILTAVGIYDFTLTRRVRRARDETLSFVQTQIMKVWWLLVGLIVVLNLGMSFFGGGYMFYGVVLAIMGIAFYVQGLFSEQMLAWIGVLLITLGLGGLALRVPLPAMEWLAVFAFGIGFPALAMAPDYSHATLARRGLLAMTWLFLVLTPTLAAYELTARWRVPDLPIISVADYVKQPAHGKVIVRLPAGTVVPAKIEVVGDDVLGETNAVDLPLTLRQSLDMVMEDGEPTGVFRVVGGDWKDRRYSIRVHDVELTAAITPDTGPTARVALRLSTGN